MRAYEAFECSTNRALWQVLDAQSRSLMFDDEIAHQQIDGAELRDAPQCNPRCCAFHIREAREKTKLNGFGALGGCELQGVAFKRCRGEKVAVARQRQRAGFVQNVFDVSERLRQGRWTQNARNPSLACAAYAPRTTSQTR